jgi:hypothetical protein
MLSNRRTRASVFGPLISALAVIFGLVLVGPVSPAGATGNGNDCVPSDAVSASFSDWSDSGAFTDWQTSNSSSDPDGQSGDDNPLNLQRAGAIDQRSVTDQEASNETVVDSPAVAGQHYSLKGNSGIGADEVPPTPADNPDIWQANTAEEPAGHYNSTQQADGSSYVAGESGLHYASHGSDGLRDWFFYQAPQDEVTHVVHHDAVTHDEYRWAIESRTYTPAKDAVTCDDNPGGNNGTIKVDDDGLPGCNVGHSQGSDVCDNGVGNDPHLGCSFYVEWYNYEANATSTVSFEVQAPTGGTVTAVQGTVAPDTVTLDGDDASGANEDGFDGSELYQLVFTDAPQQNHGWHVKVTTHTTWANGSDEKSKVFWVEGDCSPTPEDADATVDVSQPDCNTAETATPGEIENATWSSTEPTAGPGSYSYTATADEGHLFADGEDTMTFAGDLAGPLTGQQCAEVPGTQTRTESFSEDGCSVGGVHTWDVLYTTTYAWDEELQQYVGTEDEGVVQNEVYTPYTEQELTDLNCVDIEGEQGHQHHGGNNNHPEVKGEQATVPTVVPTEVEAGLAGAPAGTPTGGSSLPLWALSLGAGLFLTGAGRLRRTRRTAGN